MNARLLVTALLGVAIGAAAVTVNPLHSAPAPEPKPQRWEYKVMLFQDKFTPTGAGVSDDDVKKQEDDITEKLRTVAKDGWEYAGPVTGGSGYMYVAFRRFKP